ncbi:hypothetical protein F4604DRAFT_1929754 [Suillus subluteus]|nr:hypothetical protein F4604DRAFT_1929754 [Suillus subluteus]
MSNLAIIFTRSFCMVIQMTIFYHAEEYDSHDFAIYAPLDHPIFLLVPQEFSQQVSVFMVELGSPPDEGICKLLGVQLPLPYLPPFVEGSGPGSDMGAEKISDEESGDAELDFYEFDWTDDELL